MSGDHTVARVEEGLLLVSTPQLDDEELSWQFGSNSSLSYSEYVIVDKSPRLEVKEFTAVARKTKVCGKSAHIWELLAQEEHLALSSSLKRVDYCSNVHHDKAFGRRASALKKCDCPHVHEGDLICSIVSQSGWQSYTQPFASQNDKEQLKRSHLSSVPSRECRENQWLLPSQRLECTPQSPEFNPENQPHKLYQDSSEKRGAHLLKDGNCGVVAEQPEKLGEALCYSQTRARNAEKLASDVLVEKGKLAKLLFREASTCHTYKERVHLLELENLWLKRQSEHDTEVLPAYCNASELRSHCKFYRKGMSKGGSSLPSTIGLAFVLGLSCASAGFVIGCCMGLVGFSE